MKIMNVDIEWLGHASFLIKGNGLNIYIDPYVLKPDPEKADIILMTHDHFDHCVPENVEKLWKEGCEVIAPLNCARKCKNGRAIKEGEEIEVKGIKIKAVPAYNIGKPFHPKGFGVGYVIEIGGTKIYHAGDTDAIPEMENIECDIALLPIGGTYTMDVNDAVRAVEMINPKVVIPMHYNFLPETKADPYEFKKKVEEINPNIEVVILG